MKICGIVCEYNPFHNGHRYLIGECRRLLGTDCRIVCVMSGDFVQRGEAAVFEKHTRALAAVAGGADLVLELPLAWCMAPAETFARGGVGLLGATGCVTHLAFGSECGSLDALAETAAILRSEAARERTRELMRDGVSYAAARRRAAEELAGKTLETLGAPNDILALEYLKALSAQKLSVTPLAVRRIGAAHDAKSREGFASASLLREMLRTGEPIGEHIPVSSAPFCKAAEQRDMRAIETALLSRLRALPEEAFARAPDVSEGLERRVYAAARLEPTIEDAVNAASTKRYPKARIRRILMSAALGVRAEDAAGVPPYLRPLAMNDCGLALCRTLADTAALPLLTKPAHVRKLDERAQRCFQLGAAAADLCALAASDETGRRGDGDWRRAPSILSEESG